MRVTHVVAGTLLLVGVVGVATAARQSSAERYDFDTAHTQIAFVARHNMVTNVRGKFNRFAGHIMLDEQDVTRSSAEVTIEAASVDTDNQNRDNDLRSANFFEAEKYPNLTFKSKRVEKQGAQLALIGDLTIRDVTKEVRIPFDVTPPLASGGRKRIGVEGVLKVNRHDYGLKWNRLIESFPPDRRKIKNRAARPGFFMLDVLVAETVPI